MSNNKVKCKWQNPDRVEECALCMLPCDIRKSPTEFSKIEATLPKEIHYMPDEIDVWLEKEFGIYAGSCSSIKEFEYHVARRVAEKLWKSYEIGFDTASGEDFSTSVTIKVPQNNGKKKIKP